MNGTGNNLSRCFYDVTNHTFVGAIFGDGTHDQCNGSSYTVAGGKFDPSCSIAGFQGGGAVFASCAPAVDAGRDRGCSGSKFAPS